MLPHTGVIVRRLLAESTCSHGSGLRRQKRRPARVKVTVVTSLLLPVACQPDSARKPLPELRRFYVVRRDFTWLSCAAEYSVGRQRIGHSPIRARFPTDD